MRFVAFLLFLLVTAFARESRADESSFVPNRPLLVAGASLVVAGYAPVAAVAVPSALGLVYRGVFHFATLGLYYGLYCRVHVERDGDTPARTYIDGSYVCSGEHGAIQLLVPFAGPFLYVHNHPHDDIVHPSGALFSRTTQAALFASGASQLAGLALVIAAVALGHSERAAPARKTARWHVLPAVTPTSIGLEASLVDF